LAIRPSIFDREIRKSCRFFKNQPERCGTADAITSPSPPLKPQIVISLTVTFAFLPAASFAVRSEKVSVSGLF
jgi:hypothetical protein